MKIRAERTWYSAQRVIGILTVDGDNECFTLEDRVREIEGEPVAKWKIPGKTAIPRGTYKIALRYSPHFKREMPWLLDVPGFEYVYIHPGNTEADTEGCILVGRVRVRDHVERSREAFDDLFKLIKEALDVGEEVTIEVA